MLFLLGCLCRTLSAKAQHLGNELKKATEALAAGGADADNKDEAQMQIVGQLQTALREQAEAHAKETKKLKEKLAEVETAVATPAGNSAEAGKNEEENAALAKVQGEKKQAVDKLREVVLKYK